MTAPGLTRSESVDSGVRCWILRGPAGVVTFGQRENGLCAHVEIHSVAPMRDFHEREACDYIPGGCYLDMTATGGHKIATAWKEAGYDDELIWSELGGWYNLRLRDNPRRLACKGGAR